jgi:hypothetical protein
MFLNYTDYEDYDGQFLGCYSLASGEQLWSTTTTIKDLYYDLSYELSPNFPWYHLIDRGADVGPDGTLYGWTGPTEWEKYPGVLLAACTTGTIGVLSQLENPEGSMVLNKICMIRSPGKIALATWADRNDPGFSDTDLYEYTYDATTNTFSNVLWSRLRNMCALVRPLLFGANMAIIGRREWRDFVFYLWPEGQSVSQFDPATDMRPYGRLYHNTGRVQYTTYSLRSDRHSPSPSGFYLDYAGRAYIDGQFAWEVVDPQTSGFHMNDILLVDNEDSIVCTCGLSGYYSGLKGYEMVYSEDHLAVVSCEGEKLWEIYPGLYQDWESDLIGPAANLAPAPGDAMLLFISPIGSGYGPDHLANRMCCCRIEDAGDGAEPAVLSTFAFVQDGWLVMYVGFFCERPLRADVYTAMRTPSGELISLPFMGTVMLPMFSNLDLPERILYTPRVLHELAIGSDVTESGTYTFYALLVDSQTGEIASNLAEATASVVVP